MSTVPLTRTGKLLSSARIGIWLTSRDSSRVNPEVTLRNACKVGFAVTSSARRVIGLDAQLVINSVHDPLPGAKIPLRGLHRAMPKQELDLLKFTTG